MSDSHSQGVAFTLRRLVIDIFGGVPVRGVPPKYCDFSQLGILNQH